MNLVKPPPAVNTHLPDRIESDPSDPYIKYTAVTLLY